MSVKDLLFGKKITPDIKSNSRYQGSVQSWLPIADIQSGVITTTDGRFVKILEVLPVNFYLKSQTEQQNIIF